MAEQQAADLVLPPGVLEKLRPFNPIQRMLLSQPGTLQRTLSAYFLAPVHVRVTKQTIPGSWSVPVKIFRDVELVCDIPYKDRQARETTVCAAHTSAQITDEQLLRALLERKLGIGQAIESLGMRPSFTLSEASQGRLTFNREYALTVPGGGFAIAETFPNDLYGA